jgi:aspartyl-tRNA(Asn)/glutamyl-tRNA(Gln) amidotransferase subunit A
MRSAHRFLQAIKGRFLPWEWRINLVHEPRAPAANVYIGPKQDVSPVLSSSQGPLAGCAIAVKDNIVTADSPTTAGSKALDGYRSAFDATVVKLIREAGGTIASKTNMDEFGMGSHSQNSFYGSVKSHFTREVYDRPLKFPCVHEASRHPLSPGGSSGGSAVAVAAEECWAALGTDTGGSVRLPAAWNDVVGFKPSYGLLSRWGVIQYANSLDTVGILAENVQRAKQLFNVLNKYDGQDPTSLPQSVRNRINNKDRRIPYQLRIGVPTTYNIDEVHSAVRDTYKLMLRNLQEQGHRLVPIDLPTTRQALSAYYVLAPAEASSNLAKYDGVRYGFRSEGSDAVPKENLPLYAKTRGKAFGAEVKRRILLGAYTLSATAIDNYFIQAQKVRRLVQQDFDRVFYTPNPLHDYKSAASTAESRKDKVDIILTPTAPTFPPTIGELQHESPVESYMNDVFTVPASLACLPAASVPVKPADYMSWDLDDVETVGMQVMGQFGDDEMVLHAAELIERLSVTEELDD